jgi:Calcineurin-like phosphoesterase.
MTAPITTDDEFIQIVRAVGPSKAQKILGTTERNVYARKARLEAKLGHPITGPEIVRPVFPGRVSLEIADGVVLVGGDAHIWPGPASTCMRAFKKFCGDIKPAAVILNGDVLDFPRISRHPQNWETAPDPQEEIEAAQDYLSDIVQSCSRKTQKIWAIGNHDQRFEGMIANAIPQYRGVKGVHLSDHFPAWQKAMSCMINEGGKGATIVKHIPKGGGINATRGFTLNGGINTVHNHLHAQNVRPLSDYRDHDRYGVDTGMLADKEHKAFGYAQDAPLDWRSGFAVLTYRDGILMPPELVTKMSPTTVWFRGSLHRV